MKHWSGVDCSDVKPLCYCTAYENVFEHKQMHTGSSVSTKEHYPFDYNQIDFTL